MYKSINASLFGAGTFTVRLMCFTPADMIGFAVISRPYEYSDAKINNDRHVTRCAAFFAIAPIIIPTLINWFCGS